MDLIATLKRPEGKTLEFKRDLSSPRGIVRTVVAFANTAGGVLLIGVEDKTGFVRGVADVLAAEERLANILADTVTPQAMPDIEVLPWRDMYVLAAEVFPSPRRPHRVRAEGANGVYVRVGSTNRRADPPLVDEMRRFANRQAYDEEPLPQLRSEAVDFRAASEWFAPKRKLRRSDLDMLRLVARDQARKVPTVGGILLFGSEKERHFPDAWIQAGRFRGENRVHIADQRDIRGHAPALVERATAFVVEHLSCGAHIEGTRREDRWNVPPVAVREAIVNAVAHADYAQRGGPIRVAVFADRVEVENPGLLPFGLTIEDLPLGVSKLRNRVIARVFHELGLMERPKSRCLLPPPLGPAPPSPTERPPRSLRSRDVCFVGGRGSGVQRMMAACEEAGCPHPVFEELGGRFRVTLGVSAPSAVADDVDARLLDALRAQDGLSTQQLAAAIERTPRTTRTRLKRLVERGQVREVGSGANDPRRRYYLMD